VEDLMGSQTTSALSPGTHTIDVDGIAQRYHVAGTGPVCVVHSGGPGIDWESTRMPLLEESLTVVYVEPIGTGESGRLSDPADYHLDNYVRFLHAVVEHLDVPGLSLLGHSHGGFVAQRYVLDHPDRITGLVLYDSSPVTGPEFWGAAIGNIQRFAERHPDRPEAADIVAAFGSPHDQLNDEEFTAVLRTVLPAYFADYWGREAEFLPLRNGLRAWQVPTRGQEPVPFDVRETLHDITVPTLIVVGTHDFICGPTWADMLRQGIAGSELVVLADSGHLGHIEQPDLFGSVVTEFVLKSAVG
jgi:proline iminopeptidase